MKPHSVKCVDADLYEIKLLDGRQKGQIIASLIVRKVRESALTGYGNTAIVTRQRLVDRLAL